MTHRTSFPPLPTTVAEFEDTRPALYYAADRWSHLPDGRRRDRRAANDPVRPAATQQAAPAPAAGAPARPERRRGWSGLGLLSVVAATAVALLGMASVALDAEPAGRAGAQVAAATRH